MSTPSRRRFLLGGIGLLSAGAACSGSASSTLLGSSRPTGAGATSPGATAAPATTAPASAATGAVAGPAVEVQNGPRTAPAVALTFHGGGDPALAVAILEALERAGGVGTVMAIGQWLEATPSLAARILDHGHGLGNHTYSHREDLDRVPETVVRDEFARCADVLARLTGSIGEYCRPSATYHPSAVMLRAAGEVGYHISLSYDVDPLDYQDPGADAVVTRTLDAVEPGSIVSLHMGHAGTVAAIPRLVSGLTARGLRTVTAHQLLH